MIEIKRTDSEHKDFHDLVGKLNTYLLQQYGNLQDFYSQFNKIDNIPYVVLIYVDNVPVACGCFKRFEDTTCEAKRMFVVEEFRGKGLGPMLLGELESWATELGYTMMVLEHGNRQPEASRMYKKMGYTVIPNYGQYVGMEETSICMKKDLVPNVEM